MCICIVNFIILSYTLCISYNISTNNRKQVLCIRASNGSRFRERGAMIRKKINDNWIVSSGENGLMSMLQGGDPHAVTVHLPHDAMIHEKRTPDTKNGSQTGFYPGNVYTYTRQLDVPDAWEGNSVMLEFEGVYANARVYINGDYAGGHPYGYTNFYVACEDFLRYGETNEIKVIANNQEQTSRWYSGGGIYRNVSLLLGGPVHLKADGLKVSTPDADGDYAVIVVKTALENAGMLTKKVMLHTEITDGSGNIVASDRIPVTSFPHTCELSRQRMAVKNPLLWDCDTPNLYTCRVTVTDNGAAADEAVVSFGIRTLRLSAAQGLCVNGKSVKLRGTCIHHDNGILGAATLERAEERRCEQLKAAGFNCIRSAHHPMSKAMLDACDRIGMYVMDELSDMWTRSKNANDYSQQFPYFWEKDVERMVDKDFNHPCVLMYSMGNEIPEAGTAKGAQLNRRINNKFKELDDSRYTTNAINGLLAGAPHMGEIMADILGKEQMAQMAASLGKKETEDDRTEGGADALNGMMAVLSGPLADRMATSPVLSGLLEETASGMDITGYNYLTALHAAEKEFHPNRVVIGSETFPGDIVRLWDVVKKNDHVIGDMTWTGYDYLGEAGCGIFYYDGTQNFTSHWPDSIAYIGDIDITGYRRPISYLREIVFGLRKNPYLAVLRMNRNGQKSSLTPWMWKDNIASWTWPGYEGQTAYVDVYADAEEAELFLNGSSLGKKAVGDAFMAAFEIPYQPGELKAVSYKDGRETGSCFLQTADSRVEMDIACDRTQLKADGADLSYLTICFRDACGRINLNIEKEVTIQVQGCGTLQGFGSADPQTLNRYDNPVWTSYDGYLLAAVRAGYEKGIIKVTLTSEGCETRTVEITTV